MADKKIMLIAGARPNFLKIAPIARELDKHTDVIDYKIVHTGQHYDRNMSDVFFEELGVRKPDYRLEVGAEVILNRPQKLLLNSRRRIRV